MNKRTSPAGTGATALHAQELQFLLPEGRTNTRAVFGGASLSWSVFLIGLAILMWTQPKGSIRNALPSFESPDLVYIQELGLGGGGGGGGNRSPDPPKMSPTPKVTSVEPDPIPVATAEPITEPEPILAAQVPAMSTITPLAVPGPPSNTDSLSRGPGDDGGAGGKDGTGIGPDKGPGLGPGKSSPGDTDGPQRGPGITNPTLISNAKPSYTNEAMIRRIQGIVVLDCVVARNGTVDNCTIVKSLDPIYGLDEQAIKAAKQFRFTPGRKQGEPVPVLVRIEIVFTMR